MEQQQEQKQQQQQYLFKQNYKKGKSMLPADLVKIYSENMLHMQTCLSVGYNAIYLAPLP